MFVRVLMTVACFQWSMFYGQFSMAYAQRYEQNVKQIIEALSADSLIQEEKLIQQALLLDPTRKSNAILHQYLGEIYRRSGENDRALDAYTKGIDFSPTTLGLYLSRGSLYVQLNNRNRAMSDYNKVLELEPDN